MFLTSTLSKTKIINLLIQNYGLDINVKGELIDSFINLNSDLFRSSFKDIEILSEAVNVQGLAGQIKLDDGNSSKIITLDKPNKGLYVSPMIWRELTPLENNGVCIVLASRKYEEDDYIHDYKEYLSLVG